MRLEDLEQSQKKLGQLIPVLRDKHGNIIDGFHRVKVDPNWKSVKLEHIEDEVQRLAAVIAVNCIRREVKWEEKTKLLDRIAELSGWSPKEIAEAIGMSEQWVWKYISDKYKNTEMQEKGEKGAISRYTTYSDQIIEKPPEKLSAIPEMTDIKPEETPKPTTYNVWGLKEDFPLQQIVAEREPIYGLPEFYGNTSSYVIKELLLKFNPKTVLDSMAGSGTMGDVCKEFGIDCDQYDLNPYPDKGVKVGDATSLKTEKKYDLIFNHFPYWKMVDYGDQETNLSNVNLEDFLELSRKVFLNNKELLSNDGVFAVLIGDIRDKGRLVPLTAHLTMIGLETGFYLFDAAIKLTGGQRSSGIQEYRAEKFGYFAQKYDTVLMFKKEEVS